ncbi:hypothetical protein FRB95_006267 [Tulasnella sp. JGI-2019a]|nr:hypothetical protein FRB95_006267 [Tulasnella sp. JGI-2019a]
MSNKIITLPYPPNLDYAKQGAEVPGTKKPGQTGAYRDVLWGPKHFPYGILPGKVLPDLFDSGLAYGRDRNYLGHRQVISEHPLVLAKEYTWESYGQVDKRRRAIGSAMELKFKSGMYPKGAEFETIGIWSINRPEWQIIDLACQAYNKVSVSLYDTLGPDACEYIIKHAEISLAFATTQHIATLLAISHRTPTLKTIVSIEKLHHTTRDVLTRWGKERGIEIMDLPEFEALGEKNLIAPLPCVPDTVTSICYTSGTTNNPKGVVLTHGNLASAALACLHGSNYNEKTILLSYLPLERFSFQRTLEIVMTSFGGSIGYFSGDPLRLLEDCQILRPDLFASVPRVLNRLYQAAMQGTKAPGLGGALYRKALETKMHYLHTTGQNKHALYDRLVFSKIQAVLGGRVGVIISGSAPISRDVMDFLKIGFACDVIEGWGLTETCAVGTLGWIGDPTSTTMIGPPRLCSEIKLVDVPEMNYLSTDKPNPRGEVCIRGPNVFKRYFKDEKNTKEALDAEGWFRTGDVAEVDAQGRFKIIDRIKNIMKLAQGEYVALEKIENTYSACPVVGQVYVHGDSLKDHLIAVVVPDPVILSQVVGHDVSGSKLSKACDDPKVADEVLKMLSQTAKKAGLKGFEQVKAVHLTTEPFSVENGMLTPTFKIRRRDAAAFFKEVLDGLYARNTQVQ